jgi:hypothetical protein
VTLRSPEHEERTDQLQRDIVSAPVQRPIHDLADVHVLPLETPERAGLSAEELGRPFGPDDIDEMVREIR